MRIQPGAPLQPTTIGWYGKLASRGDFLGSGLPRPWQELWDGWLQRAMAEATRQIGGELLRQRLLAMAPWHCLVLPADAGEPVWSGIVTANGDRVGRVFPLLLAEAYDPQRLDGVELGPLQARARQIAGWLQDGAPELAPREFGAGVAHWGREPWPRLPAGTPTGATLADVRRLRPDGGSLWWRLGPVGEPPAAPFDEAWPPREALLLEWLAVSD